MTAAAPDQDQQSPKPELGLAFVLLVGMSVAVTAFLPAAFFQVWRQLVMSLADVIGGMFGLAVSVSADVLTVNGFSMRVIDECTALNYVIILSTAILLYSRHSLRYRLLGVLTAAPVVVLVNAFRLVITGVSGTISRKLFDFVHEYLWVALFALLIFGLWKVWADKNLRINRQSAIRIATIVAGCSAMFALILAVMPIYAPALSYLSSLLLKICLGDGSAAIVWGNSKLYFQYGGASYQVPFALEYFNVAVFAGLVLPLQRRGDWKMLASTIFGFLGAVFLNAALIAATFLIVLAQGAHSLPAFLFIEKGLLLAVPFALWWIVSSPSEDQRVIGNENNG
jgi:exosortase/archaeosortase family protein